MTVTKLERGMHASPPAPSMNLKLNNTITHFTHVTLIHIVARALGHTTPDSI